MTAVDDRTIDDWIITATDVVPRRWRSVLDAADAEARCDAARALWPAAVLAELPRFHDALLTELTDVRPVLAAIGDGPASPALVYITATDDEVATWIGCVPGAGAVPPLFRGSFPDLLLELIGDVHAGFVSAGPLWYGVTRPEYMRTYAEMSGFPDGFPDWDERNQVSSTRLLHIGSHGYGLQCFVSPDVPAGRIARIYDGTDLESVSFAAAFDRLLVDRPFTDLPIPE
jgi:hypothetical protein